MLCKCGGETIIIPRPDTPHYGERRCSKCNSFLGWEKSPKNENKRDKPKFSVDKKIQKGIDFCQFCGRKKHELGLNETLTIDHTIPLSEGGEDTEKNSILLCTACHKLKHWHRLYNYTHWEGTKWKSGNSQKIIISA
jgi:5-methylcytosine-specific restriction endonuclease McrA